MLIQELKDRNLLNYGAFIEGKLVRELLEIEYPTVEDFEGLSVLQIKSRFDTVELNTLSGIETVRKYLLGQGMYLQGIGDNYRILLPSENKKKIEDLISSATRKLHRAQKLSTFTPKEHRDGFDQTEMRIMMKLESKRGFEDRTRPSI